MTFRVYDAHRYLAQARADRIAVTDGPQRVVREKEGWAVVPVKSEEEEATVTPVCLYCGIALRRSNASNFCKLQHAASFADAIVELGFPRPHRRTQWCKDDGGCLHLPLAGSATEMTPWQKIMRAYYDPLGVRGCRLTPEDVMRLGMDDAIETRATYDTEYQCETRKHRKVGRDQGGGEGGRAVSRWQHRRGCICDACVSRRPERTERPLREPLHGLSVLMMRPDAKGFYFLWTEQELAVVNFFQVVEIALDRRTEQA